MKPGDSLKWPGQWKRVFRGNPRESKKQKMPWIDSTSFIKKSVKEGATFQVGV